MDTTKVPRKDAIDQAGNLLYSYTYAARVSVMNNGTGTAISSTGTAFTNLNNTGASVTFLVCQENSSGLYVVGWTTGVGSLGHSQLRANINPKLPIYVLWEGFQTGNGADHPLGTEAISLIDEDLIMTSSGNTAPISSFSYFDSSSYKSGTAANIISYTGKIFTGPDEVAGARLISVLESIVKLFSPPSLKTQVTQMIGIDLTYSDGTKLPVLALNDLSFLFTSSNLTQQDFRISIVALYAIELLSRVYSLIGAGV
jgi:hypothetical protein